MDIIEFNGKKYRLQKSGYYSSSTSLRLGYRKYKKITFRLHREIWKYHNGDIPLEMEIHHKDEDMKNNDISNLELVTRKEHNHRHLQKRLPQLLNNFKKASQYWKTEEGKKLAAKKSQKIWEKELLKIFKCEECGKEFQTRTRMGSKYCSNSCKGKGQKKVHEKRICEICGKEYEIWLHSKNVVCGRSCGGKYSHLQRIKNVVASLKPNS